MQQAFSKAAAAFRVPALCVDFIFSHLEALATSSILLPGLNWRLLPAGHILSHPAGPDIGPRSCLTWQNYGDWVWLTPPLDPLSLKVSQIPSVV